MNYVVQKYYFLDNEEVRNNATDIHQMNAYQFAYLFNFLHMIVDLTV